MEASPGIFQLPHELIAPPGAIAIAPSFQMSREDLKAAAKLATSGPHSYDSSC